MPTNIGAFRRTPLGMISMTAASVSGGIHFATIQGLSQKQYTRTRAPLVLTMKSNMGDLAACAHRNMSMAECARIVQSEFDFSDSSCSESLTMGEVFYSKGTKPSGIPTTVVVTPSALDELYTKGLGYEDPEACDRFARNNSLISSRRRSTSSMRLPVLLKNTRSRGSFLAM